MSFKYFDGFIKHTFQGVTGEWFVKNNMFQLYNVVHTNGDMYGYWLSPGAEITIAAAFRRVGLCRLKCGRDFLRHTILTW
jgi:hypothetical protein